LIVFGRDLGLRDGSLGPAVAVVIVSLLASYLSYRFVETPFRDRARFPRRRLYTLVFGGLAAWLALSIGYLGFKDAVRARYPASVLALDDAQRDISPMRETCHPSHGIADPAKACVFGGQAPDTALWGDSHGVEFAYALGKRRHPVLSITYSSCPPAQDFAAASRSECADHNRLVARYLADSREIHTVVLAAFYTAQIDTPGFKEGVTKTVDGLVQAGKTVVIIGPTPGESERNLPKRLARGGEARITRGEYDRGQAKVIAFLNELAAKGARIVWPSDYLCDARYCTVLVSGRPLLFDEHHLSMAGAKYLAKVAAPLIWPPDREGLPARPSDQASEADVRR
jgi:hypothetical protein